MSIYLHILHSLPPFYVALEKGEITPGTAIIIRYQGPKGAPGMPEVSDSSSSYLKSS